MEKQQKTRNPFPVILIALRGNLQKLSSQGSLYKHDIITEKHKRKTHMLL